MRRRERCECASAAGEAGSERRGRISASTRASRGREDRRRLMRVRVERARRQVAKGGRPKAGSLWVLRQRTRRRGRTPGDETRSTASGRGAAASESTGEVVLMASKGALRRAEVCWTMSMLSVRRPRRKGRWARQTRATTACRPRGMHSSRRSTCLHRRPRPRERRPPAQEADPVRSSRRVSCCRRGRRRRARCSTRAPCPLASVPRCLASLPREWSRLGAYLRCGVECAGSSCVKSTGGARAAVVGLPVGARRASWLTRAGLARPGRRASGDLWRDLGEDGGRSGLSLGAVGGVDVSVGEHCFSK